jgi:glycosyltransferase involved in cell wall biosynthesis
MNSLIIPVYKNEENIVSLITVLQGLNSQIKELEVVFVVDGSPDSSSKLLLELLPTSGLTSQALFLSRNFGSFAAIRAGLHAAKGQRFAIMAADMQEPPELVTSFFYILANEQCDIVIATRESRFDSLHSRLASNVFWSLYRKFVMPEMPKGGVDIFACNLNFRDQLLLLEESHSSLIALLFWMGFRRKFISYVRQARLHGKSAWTFKKKWNYFKDSIFSFTDAPIKLLTWMGLLGIIFSITMASIILIAKLAGAVSIPGYSATILAIIFFGAINLCGLGIIGTYAWRAYENTKRRPFALIMNQVEFSIKSIK